MNEREPAAARSAEYIRRILGWRTVVALAVLVTTACDRPEPPPPSDPALRAELGIADDVVIHRIDLSGRREVTRVLPPVLEIHPDDVVQFVVLDNRVHLVRFLEDSVAPEIARYLRETDQDRPPPLLERDARFVLSFAEAPVGVYRFQVEGSGDPVPGEIRVNPR